MTSRVGPIVLVLTGLLSAPAQAQLLFGPAWESNITLTQDDLDLIHRTVDTQIHGKPVGTTASWSNPNTGNAGTIKLVRRFRKGNLQCEQVAYTLTTTKKGRRARALRIHQLPDTGGLENRTVVGQI
jgi:surface antigen